MESYFMSGGSG